MSCLDDLPTHPFTIAEAKALGISRHRLEQAVSENDVRRILRGVYVRTDLEDSIELRVRALSLVMNPHTVVCDRTAAWLYGIDLLQYRELDVLPPVDTCAFRGKARTSRAECTGLQRELLPGDVRILHGVPVTTPLRTAMDLACALPRWRALAALDAFMRAFGITHADMRAMLPRYAGRRGVVQLRQLLPIADPRAESPRESWMRIEIRDAGLPTPVPQYWVTEGGRPVFRVDLAYPHAKIAIEYDGAEFHDTSDEQRERDRHRRKWLRDRGWTVIVLDKNSVSVDATIAWTCELREALRIAT